MSLELLLGHGAITIKTHEYGTIRQINEKKIVFKIYFTI